MSMSLAPCKAAVWVREPKTERLSDPVALRVSKQILRKITSGRRARSARLLVGGPPCSMKAKSCGYSREVGMSRLRRVSEKQTGIVLLWRADIRQRGFQSFQTQNITDTKF